MSILDEVRRKDREITDTSEIEELLRCARVGHLGTYGDDYPYVTPFNYVYAEGRIALHLSSKGRAFRNMMNHSRVCFEVSEAGRIIEADSACKTGMEYRSVIAFGVAEIVDEREVKKMWLQRMLDKYRSDGRYASIRDEELDKVAVALIRLQRVTGKKRIFP